MAGGARVQADPALLRDEPHAPAIIKDFSLDRHGYKIFPMGPCYQTFPNGRSLPRGGHGGTIVHSERAEGVVLETGPELRAPVVVTSLHPRAAFLDHVGSANPPDDFVRDIEYGKTRSDVVKIDLAVSELPDFTANPGSRLQPHHTGTVSMAPSTEYIEPALMDAREGRAAERPSSESVIPTTSDRTLSSEGTHIVSLFSQRMPAEWADEPHTEELEGYADRLVGENDVLAPNLKRSILHRDIEGPYDTEHAYGVIGGNIIHGELSVEQLFHMRPADQRQGGLAGVREPLASA